jgi:hypothetical protein
MAMQYAFLFLDRQPAKGAYSTEVAAAVVQHLLTVDLPTIAASAPSTGA